MFLGLSAIITIQSLREREPWAIGFHLFPPTHHRAIVLFMDRQMQVTSRLRDHAQVIVNSNEPHAWCFCVFFPFKPEDFN